MIINLAVEDTPHRAGFIRHRLSTGFRQVDEGETRMEKSSRRVRSDSVVVQVSVMQRLAHTVGNSVIAILAAHPAGDSAHTICLPSLQPDRPQRYPELGVQG